jgi:hypothetical protein
MTHVIKAHNVNDALPTALWHLHTKGEIDDSRNGRVLVSPTPVITEYARPDQRVLFAASRDANPFFHFFESLWMLAGRNDVEFPAHFAANIASFSDDGETIAGAYGERWRKHFGYDQLKMIIGELKANPKTRRCVLTMWSAGYDDPHLRGVVKPGSNGDLWLAMNGGKDVPCNTQCYFDTLGGKLNMTVTCRSNDAIWGCYGANMVHFSMLLEYVACSTGIPMGVYRQFSNNFHIYADRPDVQRLHDTAGVPVIGVDDRYATQELAPYPLIISGGAAQFDNDLAYFFSVWRADEMQPTSTFMSSFFANVAAPLWNSHLAYKLGDFEMARNMLGLCDADDWALACHEWLQRREEKRNAKA